MRQKVWVVRYNSYHDGEFSHSGMKGVFSTEDAARKAKDNMDKTSCCGTEVFIESADVQE